MKKALLLILALALVCTSISLFACNANLVNIEFKESSVPKSVEYNSQIDYSKIIILAEYDNDRKDELSLTDTGVAYTAIDTSTEGHKTLTATYKGKSVQTVIEVKPKVIADVVTLSFKQSTVPTSVEKGTTIDYSAIILVVGHTVGETEEIALSQAVEGLEIQRIDTSVAGTKTLTVKYLGKTVQAAIVVTEPSEPDEYSIAFKAGTVPTNVDLDATVDYSGIILVVTDPDGSTEEIALSQTVEGLEVERIDTSAAGTKTLTVKYLGQTAQAAIIVNEKAPEPKTVITEFLNTVGYLAYLDAKGDKTNKDTQFTVQTNLYEVGVDNGYKLIPQVSGIDVEGEDFDSFDQVKTTYTLYVKNADGYEEVAEDQISNYVEKVQNNVYYFTKQAVGEQLKIEVTLSSDYELIDDTMSTTISQEFKLVNGYNVYDAIGLSVLDNLNVNSWANIKNTALAWDNGKKLSEFTDVEQVVIHNNITVTVNDLPSNYFWQKGEQALEGGAGVSYDTAESETVEKLKKYFEGSLKEVYLGETWEQVNGGKSQRGLYVTNGIGISGNYLTLSYKSGLDANGEPTGKGLYTAWDWNARNNPNPESHYGFVSYREYDGITADPTGNGTVSNVYFVGQTQKTNNIDLPTALMMVTGNAKKIKVVNTIGTQWYVNGVYDGRKTVVTFEDCKLFESFSQMVMTIRIKELNIIDTEMRNAGGPMLVIQTQSGNDPTMTDFSVPTAVNIDSASKLENWVTPSANWFAANGIPESMASQLLNFIDLADANAGSTFVKNENGMKYYNFWGVLIPAPSYVFNNVNKLEGSLNIGDNDSADKYGMDEEVFEALTNLYNYAQTGVQLATAINQSNLAAGFTQLQQQTSALRIAPIYKSGSVYATTTGTNFVDIVGMVKSGVNQLYQGSLQVVQQMVSLGQTEAATAWQQLADNLKPIVDAAALDAEDWSAGWKTEHVMSFWINPAAAAQRPNPDSSVKHFMILVGDNTASAD